jgi:hypothetical protein
VHALVQHLADLDADAEGEPRRPVPRLPHDTAIPDQLKVVTADLLAAGAPTDVLAAATAEVTETTRTL